MIHFGQITICSASKTIWNGVHELRCASGANGGPEAVARFKTFKYLLCANGNGLAVTKLFELVYGDDPEGGPVMGTHIFYVHFANWEGVMSRMRLAIKREK